MSAPATVCRPRNTLSSDYYRCLVDYFENLVIIYNKHFSKNTDSGDPEQRQACLGDMDCFIGIMDEAVEHYYLEVSDVH